MMNNKILIKAGCLIMTLGLCLTGCSERQFEGQEDIYSFTQSAEIEETHEENDADDINEENTDKNENAETVDIAYYVGLLEQTIACEAFFGRQIVHEAEGVRNTDFYIDRVTGEIFFNPEGSKRDYRLITQIHYDKYGINVSPSIAEKDSLEWIGNAEVNYDVAPEHHLPELTENDKEILNEVCDFLYDKLTLALDEFTFDVYLGDFYRGYDGKEYIMIDFAMVGDGNYLRWVELTEEEDGYKIWLYPELIHDYPDKTMIAEEWESDQKYIDNIVSLGYLIRRLEK